MNCERCGSEMEALGRDGRNFACPRSGHIQTTDMECSGNQNRTVELYDSDGSLMTQHYFEKTPYLAPFFGSLAFLCLLASAIAYIVAN